MGYLIQKTNIPEAVEAIRKLSRGMISVESCCVYTYEHTKKELQRYEKNSQDYTVLTESQFRCERMNRLMLVNMLRLTSMLIRLMMLMCSGSLLEKAIESEEIVSVNDVANCAQYAAETDSLNVPHPKNVSPLCPSWMRMSIALLLLMISLFLLILILWIIWMIFKA